MVMPFVERAVRTFSKIRDKSCEKIMVSTLKNHGAWWGVFKMPRRRRQRERHKSKRLNRQNNNSARASQIFVHFFPVSARLRPENAFLWRTRTSDDKNCFLNLNLDIALEFNKGLLAFDKVRELK